MIDSLEGLKKLIYRIDRTTYSADNKRIKIQLLDAKTGYMYCPTCGDNRKMSIEILYRRFDQTIIDQLGLEILQRNRKDYEEEYLKSFDIRLCPSLYKYVCLQCNSTFTSIIYSSPNGQELAIFPSSLSTPNTPSSVAYYLDQASKSHSVGANSAAMAMYRATLEHLLFQQGFIDGMLGQKINMLVKSIENNKAPKWAYELDADFLKYIKELGNGAIHTNDGNVEQQKHIDNTLISGVKEFYKILLFLVYEYEGK